MARVKNLPILFWIASLVGLVWYVTSLGNAYFLWVVYEYSVTPLAVPAVFLAMLALNIGGGLLGYIFLMLNKKLSLILFQISVIAGFGQIMYISTAEFKISYFGWAPDNIQPFIILVAAFASVVFARISLSKGWVS